jgi:outer membrane protein OmpA-like peptidoglycan-associated protein
MKYLSLLSLLVLLVGCSTLSEQHQSAVIDQTPTPINETRPNDTIPVLNAPGENLLFAFDSFQLSPEQFIVLRRWADYINQANIAHISIHGHADETGSADYNYTLSQKRAETVQHQLQKLLNRAVTIKLYAHGEEQPITGNDTEQQRQQNRRVEFETSSDQLSNHPSGSTNR